MLEVLKTVRQHQQARPKKSPAKRHPAQTLIHPAASGGFALLLAEPEAMSYLERHSAQRHQALVHERTVRIRGQGEPDRRYAFAYAIDPDDNETVIFRVRALSDRALGPMRIPMLSTQQAADLLNVSRPYVVKLVEDGVFQGVERTQAGHRRIPAPEVERVRLAMQTSRRTVLNRLETLTSDQRAQELETARAVPARRWTKSS
ncbi:excisionase family DNA-binding protein [Achromobacter sp. Marseille-Q0513]|uniref:excisionase family DNA-binding protein n=1 Tax=Achromobacter sp. Marseille-Q0513 TaxID=2829161 RepID=UPI0032C3E4A3